MTDQNEALSKRTPEQKSYDKTDWPGSSSFHPPHINAVFRKMLEGDDNPETNLQQELPFEDK